MHSKSSFSLLANSSYLGVNIDKLVLLSAHAELSHIRELTQAVARFNALDQIVVMAVIAVDQIDAGLISRQNVRRSHNSDVRNRGLSTDMRRITLINVMCGAK